MITTPKQRMVLKSLTDKLAKYNISQKRALDTVCTLRRFVHDGDGYSILHSLINNLAGFENKQQSTLSWIFLFFDFNTFYQYVDLNDMGQPEHNMLQHYAPEVLDNPLYKLYML